MRYLWDLYPAYLREWTPVWKRPLMAPLASYLRLWDYCSAQRVDEFVANSANVGQRIWRCYRRESRVIHPPVAVETFYTKPAEDYFLVVSELVPYKRVDVAVRLFSQTGRRLKIVGAGPSYSTLRRLAQPNVEFCGRVGDAELRDLYARARAFLMPGEEDFGITAVEALASGKPVIALARGGVLESVPRRDPVGGVFYEDAGEEGLSEAISRFEAMEPVISAEELQRHAIQFSEPEFRRKMAEVLGVGTELPVSGHGRR
jgi:glycosyltransferase involved in cell wall biosynthesis